MYSILFFLDYCTSVLGVSAELEGVLIFVDCCAKRSVFLEGFKVTLLVVYVVI